MSGLQPALYQEVPKAATAPFDVRSYLVERVARTSFLMVEIGHGGTPVAYQQPAWEGNRRYIGAEAWLRDTGGLKRNKLRAQIAAHPNPNIAFVTIDPGGEVEREGLEQEGEHSWYSGEYDPTLAVAESTANEVFFGNVFGDNHVGDSPERVSSLLTEATRLLVEDGVIVVRETITPREAARSLSPDLLGAVGLRVSGHVAYRDSSWAQLEALYDGQVTNWFPNNHNFYQFLTKTAAG